MWKIYTPNGNGVAIQSTIERLSKCFVKKPHDHFEHFYPQINKVNYIDFRKYDNNSDAYEPFIHKLKAYSYEKEIRMLISHMPTIDPPRIGIALEIDLDMFLHKIYISHKLGDGLEEFVREALKEKGVQKEIIHPPFVRTPKF